MRIIVSVDDYGLTEGITDTILEAVDAGFVSSVSVIANGDAFAHAIAEYSKRGCFRLSVRLNLVEGPSVAPRSEVSLLLGKDGQFKYSFVSLVLRYLFSSRTTKEILRRQVARECAAQIEKVRQAAGEGIDIGIDGHQHTHMIPFVFDAILSLGARYRFSRMRIPREPFFAVSLKNYANGNILKHFLLNILSRRNKKRLLNIPVSDWFIGVLETGDATIAGITHALGSIAARRETGAKTTVEVLLHPGEARADKKDEWRGRRSFLAHYYAAGRSRERAILASPDFKKVVELFGTLV
ncbi:hypothetical protein AUJ44_00365 [Candidatus Nomurabacteria bacterium CG1_02_47_685]|uniref:ChbG/HpnK family deacetylase n=1 Tax=Candidatus Nomurabacteria bacterium CG1_02_47_685 TaxID=1805282 RepID=A0A1J4V8K2_9BACT|nr:MAG: hypothetical protein AUJ44_00365 [Candidatus Nomurabacteria bacterium CG1_02_47_685]